MVEETALSRRIDVRLRTLASRLEVLPMHDGAGTDLVALDVEWRDTLDRFDQVHAWFVDGEMTRDQAARHRQNLSLLARRLPLVHRLGLAVPRGALAAWLDAHPAPRSIAEPA